MHRKTAFIANQLSEAVAEAIAEPEKIGQSEGEVKMAAASHGKKRNRRRGKKRA